MQKFTLGFVFSNDLEKVLLVHKQKPDFQKGKINGVGGKVEVNESLTDCIARECVEESTLTIEPNKWHYVATLNQTIGPVTCFTAIYNRALSDAKQGDYEAVEWFSVDELPENVMRNLHFLVPMAKQQLIGPTYDDAVFTY